MHSCLSGTSDAYAHKSDRLKSSPLLTKWWSPGLADSSLILPRNFRAAPSVDAEKRKKRLLSKGAVCLRADLERAILGGLQGALHRTHTHLKALYNLANAYCKRCPGE